MDFDFDAEFDVSQYVRPERFPDGAAVRECRFCGVWLVVPTGEQPDCGRHLN